MSTKPISLSPTQILPPNPPCSCPLHQPVYRTDRRTTTWSRPPVLDGELQLPEAPLRLGGLHVDALGPAGQKLLHRRLVGLAVAVASSPYVGWRPWQLETKKKEQEEKESKEKNRPIVSTDRGQ